MHWLAAPLGFIACYAIWVSVRGRFGLTANRFDSSWAGRGRRLASVAIAAATAYLGTGLAGIVSALLGKAHLLGDFGWGAFAVLVWAMVIAVVSQSPRRPSER